MGRWVARLVICSASVYGQQTPAPRFEVASVKPVAADQPNGSSGGQSRKGRLSMSNVTLKRCIMGAYGLGPNLIVGGPAWLDTDRFEITAKAEQPVGDSTLMVMLQSLLAERFQLSIHRETRTIPVLALEVARGGPKLEVASGDSTTASKHGSINATGMSMERFAEVLSRQMDVPVVNHTGIEGKFNLKLEWTPESNPPKPDSGPSIFTAVQEELGLRLRSQKALIEVLVVDHAERPVGN